MVSGNGVALSPSRRSAHPAEMRKDYHRLPVRAEAYSRSPAPARRTTGSRVQRFNSHFHLQPKAPEITRKYIDADDYLFFLGNTDPKKNTPRVLKAYSDYLKKSTKKLPLLIADLKEDAIRPDTGRRENHGNKKFAPLPRIYCEYRPCGTLWGCIRIPVSFASRKFRHPDARSDGLRNAHHRREYFRHARNSRRRRFAGRPFQRGRYYRQDTATRRRRSVLSAASGIRAQPQPDVLLAEYGGIVAKDIQRVLQIELILYYYLGTDYADYTVKIINKPHSPHNPRLHIKKDLQPSTYTCRKSCPLILLHFRINRLHLKARASLHPLFRLDFSVSVQVGTQVTMPANAGNRG